MRTPQTFHEMVALGASPAEAQRALELFALLRPGLKVKRNGRVDTIHGDKTPLGLYRTIITVTGVGAFA